MAQVHLQADGGQPQMARDFDRSLEELGAELYSFLMNLKKNRTLVGLLVLLTALLSGAAAQLTKEQGDSLASKIDNINQNAAAEPIRPKTTQASESEINSFLAFNFKDKIPRGLTNPQLRLVGEGQASGRVYVDLDEFRRQRSSGGMMDPFNYISGQVPMNARGILRTKNGVGQFQLAAADIHGVPLPKPLVQELVSFFSRTQERPNGFNIDEPFNLPVKIRTITIKSGEALVVQ